MGKTSKVIKIDRTPHLEWDGILHTVHTPCKNRAPQSPMETTLFGNIKMLQTGVEITSFPTKTKF